MTSPPCVDTRCQSPTLRACGLSCGYGYLHLRDMSQWNNKLYYGDNLDILRAHVADGSVDLIYLDPPFNSQASYNVLFAEQSGEQSPAQITAFEDTWHWGQEPEHLYHETVRTTANRQLADLLQAFRSFLGTSDMMAYLTMMAPRVAELHRVLKPTGSMYLHCDPTASHYLKLVLDAVFGVSNFRNEIIWRRGRVFFHTVANQFPRNHDTIFFYSKSKENFYQPQFKPYKETTLKMYRFDDHDGKGRYRLQEVRTYGKETLARKLLAGEAVERDGKISIKQYLAQKEGNVIDTVWEDIESASYLPEKLGYPTQKPESLLERIIKAS